MPSPAPQDSNALTPLAIGGALDWWREAGVDLDFVDSPIVWLPQAGPASPGPAAAVHRPLAEPAPVAVSASPVGGDPATFPASLAEFRTWWLGEPSLDDGLVRDRVPPRGEAGARIMVIVAQPEAEDRDELLSGREGRLLDNLLAAGGIEPDQVYLASALARHTPLPDWADLTERGLGRVVAHHIGLVAPQRVIVFGSNILPLIGHDMAQNAQTLPVFNHEGTRLPVLAARDIGALMARPAWKAGLWRHWLDWTGTEPK